MKKLLLSCTLMLCSASMFAQWTQTTNTKSKELVVSNGRLIGGGGGAGGILISDDEGATWTGSNNGVPAVSLNDIGPKLAIGNTIFAISVNRLVVSTDNGNTWAAGTSTLPATSIISFMYYDGSVIYVTYQDGKVYTSTDGGSTFSLKGDVGIYVVEFAAHNGALYAGTNGAMGMYKSTDGGATWVADNNGIASGDKQVYTMAELNGSLYMGSYSGKIYRLASGTWTQVYSGSPMRGLHTVGTTLMAATDNGYASSMDNGTTWTSNNTGLTGLDLYFLHIYTSTNAVYVTKFYGGVLKRSFTDLGIPNTTGVAATVINPKGINLYPNPAADVLHVSGISTASFTYTITAITGQLMANATVTTGSMIPVGTLTPGVYMIKISTDRGNFTKRFIKE